MANEKTFTPATFALKGLSPVAQAVARLAEAWDPVVLYADNDGRLVVPSEDGLEYPLLEGKDLPDLEKCCLGWLPDLLGDDDCSWERKTIARNLAKVLFPNSKVNWDRAY